MQCRATTRQVGNVAIVDLIGGITIAGGSGLLRQTIKDLLAAGHKNVVVNLRELTYLDSAGMGELVGACSSVRNLGGDLRLAHPQERIRNLLHMTKLVAVFGIFGDEESALRSF